MPLPPLPRPSPDPQSALQHRDRHSSIHKQRSHPSLMRTARRTEYLCHMIGAAPKSRKKFVPSYIPDHTDQPLNTTTSSVSHWHLSWRTVSTLPPLLCYDIPSGSQGRRFLSILSDELETFLRQNTIEPVDRCLLFCSFMLGRDPGIVQSQDIKRLLGRRLIAWEAGRFDVPFSEYTRCAHSMHTLHTRRRPSSQDDSSHIRAFTRFMLQGDLRRAIRLVMDQDKYMCLLPEDIAHPRSDSQNPQTVRDVLKGKHPVGRPVPNLNATGIDEPLPFFEAIDVTEDHAKTVAHALKPSSGPPTGIHMGFGKEHFSIMVITAVVSVRPWPVSLVFFSTLSSHGIASRPC